jgi:hypothetical protein
MSRGEPRTTSKGGQELRSPQLLEPRPALGTDVAVRRNLSRVRGRLVTEQLGGAVCRRCREKAGDTQSTVARRLRATLGRTALLPAHRDAHLDTGRGTPVRGAPGLTGCAVTALIWETLGVSISLMSPVVGSVERSSSAMSTRRERTLCGLHNASRSAGCPFRSRRAPVGGGRCGSRPDSARHGTHRVLGDTELAFTDRSHA